MKVSDFGKALNITVVALTCDFQATGRVDSNGNEYMQCALVKPVMVRCSVMKDLEAQEYDYVFVRLEDAQSDRWQPRNPAEFEKLQKKNKLDEYKDGYFLTYEAEENGKMVQKEYLIDFSKNVEEPLYQKETIAQWRRGNSSNRVAEEKEGLLARLAKRKAQKAQG